MARIKSFGETQRITSYISERDDTRFFVKHYAMSLQSPSDLWPKDAHQNMLPLKALVRRVKEARPLHQSGWTHFAYLGVVATFGYYDALDYIYTSDNGVGQTLTKNEVKILLSRAHNEAAEHAGFVSGLIVSRSLIKISRDPQYSHIKPNIPTPELPILAAFTNNFDHDGVIVNSQSEEVVAYGIENDESWRAQEPFADYMAAVDTVEEKDWEHIRALYAALDRVAIESFAKFKP